MASTNKIKKLIGYINAAQAHLQAFPQDYWALALLSIPNGKIAGLAGRVVWAVGKDGGDADEMWNLLVRLGLSPEQAHALFDYDGDVKGAIVLLDQLIETLSAMPPQEDKADEPTVE